MKPEKTDIPADGGSVVHSEGVPVKRAKASYEPPRIEKRRSVARVTLQSVMGTMGVGAIGNIMM